MQLLFPGFLWAGLGIGVPVLVHLLQLRRPQRVLFSNTAFVREIELKTGRRRLQDWLVLTMRVLAVLLLVLTFCQPYVQIRRGITGEQDVTVAVDTSPSMLANGKDDRPLLQHAMDDAGEIGRVYPDNAMFQLPGKRTGRLTGVAYSQLVSEPIGKEQGLGWGSAEARRAWQGKQNGPLYLISDFQKTEVKPGLLRQLPAGREIVLLPQTAKASGNLYVDSVWLGNAFVRYKSNVEVHIRLRNGGEEAVEEGTVKVLLMGQQVAAYQATVQPGGALETVVEVQAQGPMLAGEVHLEDGGVRFDNIFYFVVSPTTDVQVVEIGQVPVAQRAYQREALFHYSFYREQQVDFSKLVEANLVLLSGPVEVSAGLREALAGVVRRGGSVVVVPPVVASAHSSYTQLLQVLGVGTVQWEDGAPVKQELRLPNAQSPFFREVFGAQPRLVALPEASPVLRVADGGTDILRLRDGSAFLTEFAAGTGKVYLFAAPFDQAYTDFASQSLFVPVLYRMALLSFRDDQPLAYRVGQEVLTLTVPVGNTTTVGDAASYRLVQDSLTLVPGQRQLGRQLRLQIPTQLTMPGFYQVRRQGQTVATLAFNYPRRESELAAYSVAELRALVGPDRPNVRVLEPGTQVAALAQYRAEQSGQPLWRYCLLAALACLLAEELVLRLSRRMALVA